VNRKRFRIGIVGLTPERSWAARAHVPALKGLQGDFELAAVANSHYESAKAAATVLGIPLAFATASELGSSSDVDIVVVTVRVPRHLELVSTALNAGKHVFCEWPLGNGLAEAEELASLAKAKGVLGFVGTQARVAPQIEYLRQLISSGFIGTVLSSSIIATGGGWGAEIGNTASGSYLLDRENGATLLSIPLGHSLAAIRDVLGDISSLSAVVETRRHEVLAKDSGVMIPMTSPDQVLMSATLESGAPLSVHYRGGNSHGSGLTWYIYGTLGDIRVTAPSGHMQMVELTVASAHGTESAFQKVEIPTMYTEGWPTDSVVGNVARLYKRIANDLHQGTATAPNFADAVELHRLLASVDLAATSGQRIWPHAPNRVLSPSGS
jgi:predicted dehydrogenase